MSKAIPDVEVLLVCAGQTATKSPRGRQFPACRRRHHHVFGFPCLRVVKSVLNGGGFGDGVGSTGMSS